MNWILLVEIKNIDNTIICKLLFTDITLSIPFVKIEKILDENVEIFSKIELEIIAMLNNKVALKEQVYLVYEKMEEYNFLENYMPNIIKRITDTINLKSFLLTSLHLNRENYKNFVRYL